MNFIKNKLTKIFVAFCCVFTLIPANAWMSISATEKLNVEIIDDYDERFVYSAGNANNGGWDGYANEEPSISEHWANVAGAKLEIHFHGSKLEVFGKKAPEHRMFSVSIDGQEAVKKDAYAENKTDNNALLYSSEEAGIVLEDADHVATITLLDESNEDAVNVLGMNVAYAKVYSSQETERVSYTDVDDAVNTTSNELFKITYSPENVWTAGSGYPDLFYYGTEHYSNRSADASYRMEFIGTGFEIYATKNPGHADCDVYVDGENVGELIASDVSTVTHRQKVFEKKNLADGTHVLEVKPKEGQNKAMQLDMIRVFHEELTPSSIAFDRNEVTMIPEGTTKLNVHAEPWVVEDVELIWESSQPNVVSVSQEGVLVAKDVTEKSTAIITAKVKGDETVSAQATVTVDPSMAFMNAFIGDEKLLDLSEDYEELVQETQSHYAATMWKGDELNSKVVVASREKAIKNVEITASDFTNENGAVIHKDAVSIKWLKEVKANVGRGNAGAPVKDFPEMIHKGGAKDLEAKSIAFAWVQVDIAKDAVPGTYHGTLTVTADGLKAPFELQYEIEVLNLDQPAMESTELQVWQHPFSVANYYLGLGENPRGGITNEVAEDFYFTEAHFNLMRSSMEEYVEAGGHDAVANIVEEAWGHQSYYNDLSMVKWTKKTDGTWSFDYTWYDAWINFMIECGVLDPENGIGQIKCYSIVPWNNQIAYFDEATGTMKTETHRPGSAGWKALWTPFLEDFLNHSEENGWFDITYISMDERGLEDLTAAVEMIESVQNEEGESFKISSALNYGSPEYYDFTDRIDDISINLGHTGNVEQMKELTAHRKEKGLVTTIYTCTGDFPSSYTISDPGDNYWTIWYTMTLGTDGFLRWAWDNYLYDMHGNVSYRYWEPGDGWMIYPEERELVDVENGEVADFYTTPRYEMLKQGIRDVAKAKYLLSSNNVTDEQKEDLKAVVENLQRPNGSTSHGSRVPASEEDRMLVHSETARALEATNNLAREIAPEFVVVNKAELNALIEKAETLKEEEYTADSWKVLSTALQSAKNVSEKADATQLEVDNATKALEDAIQALELKAEVAPEKEEETEKAPGTGDFVNRAVLWSSVFGAVIAMGIVLKKKRRVQE